MAVLIKRFDLLQREGCKIRDSNPVSSRKWHVLLVGTARLGFVNVRPFLVVRLVGDVLARRRVVFEQRENNERRPSGAIEGAYCLISSHHICRNNLDRMHSAASIERVVWQAGASGFTVSNRNWMRGMVRRDWTSTPRFSCPVPSSVEILGYSLAVLIAP